MRRERDFTVKLWLAATIVTLGCSDSNPAAPPIRDIEVTVTTESTSSDLVDPDGYTLIVDYQLDQNVRVNETVRFPSVSNGRHLVLLGGVAANCSVDGPNPRPVDVLAGEPQTVLITFSVHCAAASPGDPWGY